MLSTPLTNTLPVFGADLQVTATLTGVVWRALTSKVAEPPHVSETSAVLADGVIA
jgi:hypothetical protein